MPATVGRSDDRDRHEAIGRPAKHELSCAGTRTPLSPNSGRGATPSRSRDNRRAPSETLISLTERRVVPGSREPRPYDAVMSDAWPIVDVNRQLEEFGDRLLEGEIGGHRLVDELEDRDEFGIHIDSDRLAP